MAQPISNVMIDGNALNTMGNLSFSAFSTSGIAVITWGFIALSSDQWVTAEIPYNATWTECDDCTQPGDFN